MDVTTQPTKLRGLLVITAALCVALGAVAAAGGSVAAQEGDDPPPTPASYYGDVTVDGESADDGLEVTAELDGVEYGPIETDGGEYGDAGLGDKLVVDPDDDPADDEVTFFVNGEEAEETATWESGTQEQVDLSVDELPDEEEEEEDDDTSPGGGGGASPPADDDDDDVADDDPADDTAVADDDPADDDPVADDDPADDDPVADDDPADDPADDVADDDDDGIPGFGAFVAVAALLSAVVLAVRR